MNSRQFECFLEVVEQHSFSRAAEKLFLTQSVVSYQVRAIEKEIGFPLFQRNKHPIQLTKGGEILYDGILQAKSSIEKSIENGKAWYTLHHNSINICMIAYLDPEKLAMLVGACSVSLPDVQINLIPFFSSDLVARLQDKETDIFFIYQDEVEKLQGFSYIPIFKTRDYCWISHKNPLSCKSHLDVDDLKNETIVLLENFNCIKSATRAYQGIIAEHPHAKFHLLLDYERATLPLVIANSCVALAPYPIHYPIIDIKSIPYGHYDSIITCVAWRKDDCSETTSTCINLITKIFSDSQQLIPTHSS